MLFNFSAPAKTFLLGEYYVTYPGEAFLLTTEPRFKLLCRAAEFSLVNIHPESPAGKYLCDNRVNYSIEFDDPYYGLGGFGASTAQFLMAHQLVNCLTQKQPLTLPELEKLYLQYAWNGKGIAPSAADLFAQQVGKFCYINKNNYDITDLAWPFAHLQFHILHTNTKLATHTHLSLLEHNDYSNLKTIFQLAKDAIAKNDADIFCMSLNWYWQELQRLHLASQHSFSMIEQIKLQAKVLAAKGCGAMGADTILLITELHQTQTIKSLCKSLNLNYIASNYAS